LKCWKVESMFNELVILRRGKIVQTFERKNFDALFEGVA